MPRNNSTTGDAAVLLHLNNRGHYIKDRTGGAEYDSCRQQSSPSAERKGKGCLVGASGKMHGRSEFINPFTGRPPALQGSFQLLSESHLLSEMTHWSRFRVIHLSNPCPLSLHRDVRGVYRDERGCCMLPRLAVSCTVCCSAAQVVVANVTTGINNRR